MNHRHLLPNEIDLLVDGELGFGVAPLQAHVAVCDACRGQLEAARQVTAMLEELPRFAPSYGLADRVMAQVPVFVPWHIAARDAVQAWMPASRPFRALALAGGSAIAVALTMAAAWVLTRSDVITFASAAASDQIRSAFSTGVRGALAAMFGEQVFAAMVQGGVGGIGLAAAAFIGAAGVALFGLRTLAAIGRSRS